MSIVALSPDIDPTPEVVAALRPTAAERDLLARAEILTAEATRICAELQGENWHLRHFGDGWDPAWLDETERAGNHLIEAMNALRRALGIDPTPTDGAYLARRLRVIDAAFRGWPQDPSEALAG